MAAPAHLPFPARSEPAPSAAPDHRPPPPPDALPDPRTPPDAGPCALDAEGSRAHAPLTSEPPLPGAEPLTSEPPLREAARLTSESDAGGPSGPQDASGSHFRAES
ncbi:hypothetical protein [Streptomyces sp. NPDC006193]|uniref:hypothetical protein n=1 Tax=Streptomyces sp. NPDC006193 TaxID=3155717 RepID=UPI0033AFC170